MGRIKEQSILQQEERCWLCGNTNKDMLERHEVFFGNPNRQRSIEDKLTVLLCGDSCHRNGHNAVHQNADINMELKQYAQVEAMHYYGWSIKDFVERYGKNYLNEEWSK